MPTTPRRVTYSRLLRFFIPLGAMPLLIASTHTIMDSTLARLPAAEVNLAIFAIVKMLTNAIKSSDVMTRRTTTSLVDSRQSFRQVMTFSWSLCLVLLALTVSLAYTPAGGWVLQHVIGLDDPAQIELAYTSMKIAAFLPIVEVFRNSIQGIAVGLERTNILAAGTALRLILVSGFLVWVVGTNAMAGIVATSLAWTVGIGIEGVIVFVYMWYRFGSLGDAAEQMPARNHTALTTLDILKFFMPIAITITITSWLQPIIQSGLARSVSPTQSLAAYGVAWGLVFLISGPVRVAFQCSLVFTDGLDDPNWPIVQRFNLLVGAFASGVLLLWGLTPVGTFLVETLMAVPASVAAMVRPTLAAFSLLPLVRAWRESYWGILLNYRDTNIIGIAKVANLLVVVTLLVLLFGLFRAGAFVVPPVAAAIAYILGNALETVTIWRYTVRQRG